MAGTKKSERITTAPGSDLRQLEIQHNLLVADLEAMRQAQLNQAFTSCGLAIHGSASAVAKSATAFKYVASASAGAVPVYGAVAANTDTAAFAGTVLNGKFNVFVHALVDDGTGTQVLSTTMGTAGATRAAVVFPAISATKVVYGITEINPTGTGDFVGGTTALDDATVVPNAVYISVIGPVPALRSIGTAGTVIPTATSAGLAAAQIATGAGTVLSSSQY